MKTVVLYIYIFIYPCIKHNTVPHIKTFFKVLQLYFSQLFFTQFFSSINALVNGVLFRTT